MPKFDPKKFEQEMRDRRKQPDKDLTFDGIEIMDSFDEAAEAYGPVVQQIILEMEWQLRKTDGTWVRVDPERVRLARRGLK